MFSKISNMILLKNVWFWFLISQILLSWATLIPFESGWSYWKNSNAGKFVFSYRFIHINFRLVRGPVFCPVSGFCTSDGPIEKIPMQANLYSHTGSSIKISGWSGVRFSVRFPVFVLLMVISKKNLCRKISFVILVHLHIKLSPCTAPYKITSGKIFGWEIS